MRNDNRYVRLGTTAKVPTHKNVSPIGHRQGMSKALRARPQTAGRRVPELSVRFDKNSELVVKYEGKWITAHRYSAEVFAVKRGVVIPVGVRVQRVTTFGGHGVDNLEVKTKHCEAVPLRVWVKTASKKS